MTALPQDRNPFSVRARGLRTQTGPTADVPVEVWCDDDAPGLRERVEERLRTVIAPFARRVTRAALRVTDRNGTKGGVDQECRVEVVVAHRGAIVVESVDQKRWPAVLRALTRLETALHRKLTRERVRRRSSRPPAVGARPA